MPYETFAASDGDFVLAVGNDDQWRRFCAVAGSAIPTSGSRPTAQRVTGYDELRPLIADAAAPQPRQHWIERLTAAGVPCGSVRDLAGGVRRSAARGAGDDRRARARRRSARCDCSACPVKLSDTPGAVRTPPPPRSANTPTRCCGTIWTRAPAQLRVCVLQKVISVLTKRIVVANHRREPRGERWQVAGWGPATSKEMETRRGSPSSTARDASAPGAAPASGARATTRPRARSPNSSIASPCRCSSRSRSVLRVENYPFTVFTPSNNVRLMSDQERRRLTSRSRSTPATSSRA